MKCHSAGSRRPPYRLSSSCMNISTRRSASMKPVAFILLIILTFNAAPNLFAQEKKTATAEVFEKLDMLVVRGDKADTTAVRLRFADDSLIVESHKTGGVLKSFKYADIISAEYSYSKHPRWKAGLGTALGSLAAGPLFILALPIAIPLAFSKAKRHWLTLRSEQDYVV